MSTINEEHELNQKDRATLILEGEIAHWRHLEKGLGVDKTYISKKIGSLRMVLDLIKQLPDEKVGE